MSAINPSIVVVPTAELKALIEEAVRKAIASGATGNDGDRLLEPAEAAKLLSVSEEYLYRNRKKLPFARKLGPRLLRFSHQGLLKWAEAKKFDRS